MIIYLFLTLDNLPIYELEKLIKYEIHIFKISKFIFIKS